MIFTEDQLKQCAGLFAELEAKSIGSFPSEFGINTGNNELNRVFRLDISDPIDFGVAFLRKYHTASAIPDSFDPADLPADQWTVTNPMVDAEVHEGEYRHVQLRVFSQEDNGREYFFVVQTLAKGFETEATRTYEFDVVDPAGLSPDLTGLKFYDADIEINGSPVFYSKGDVYARWTHDTLGLIVSAVGEVGQTPDDYFSSAGADFTGIGAWDGSFTLSAIDETVADLSQFRLATADYYHANHSQPILRLENVSPGAANDLCEYLNQDTFTDIEYFDDTLTGTWFRIRVTTEAQDDGSHHIFLLLSDSGNSELYFKIQATPSIIKGYYFKWEATEATIDQLVSTIRFEEDGSIDEDPDSGTSSTLEEVVLGRSVNIRRGSRDEKDRLFDLEIEIVWQAEDESFLLAATDGRITYKQSKTTEMSKEWGYGLSKDTIGTIKSKYAVAAANGEVRRVDISKNKESGTYDFVGLIITKTGVSTSIRFGNKTFYLGVQEDEEPTAISLGISATANVNGRINYNAADDTWSWDITETHTQEVDGENPGGDAMIEYGEPLEIIREWQYSGKKTLPNDGLADIGTYAADGKSLTITKYVIRLNGEDATFSWKKTETVITVPDGEFTTGVDKTVERDHRLLRNWAMDSTGATWKTAMDDGIVVGGPNLLNLYLAQISRFRPIWTNTVRYFYVQQPTIALLIADGLQIDSVIEEGYRRSWVIAQHSKYLFSMTFTEVEFGQWGSDQPESGTSELIWFEDMTMTKAIWDSNNSNPKYNDTEWPVMGVQQI